MNRVFTSGGFGTFFGSGTFWNSRNLFGVLKPSGVLLALKNCGTYCESVFWWALKLFRNSGSLPAFRPKVHGLNLVLAAPIPLDIVEGNAERNLLREPFSFLDCLVEKGHYCMPVATKQK